MRDQGWDFQRALRNPAVVYETPEQVLSDPRLDTEGRRAILRNWQSRLQGKAAASRAGERQNLLRRIERALDRLEADRNAGSWLRSRRGRS